MLLILIPREIRSEHTLTLVEGAIIYPHQYLHNKDSVGSMADKHPVRLPGTFCELVSPVIPTLSEVTSPSASALLHKGVMSVGLLGDKQDHTDSAI